MNKKLLLSLSTICAGVFSAQAQTWPASSTAENKKVYLEEFTGIHCQYCPDGHKRANDLVAANPAGAVVVVNVHTGGYATPSGTEPDFRTSEGASIVALSIMNLDGYPAGAVNRHQFSGVNGSNGQPQAAESRSYWATQAPTVLSTPTYVNVAVKANLNTITNVMTINAQAYFTGASTATADNLSIILVEDSVRGPQTGASTWYPAMINSDGTYNHNHLLRKVVTASAFGDALTPRTAGSRIDKTYTYTLPAMYVNRAPVVKNLKIIAIVAQGNTEVMNAAEAKVTTGTTGVGNVSEVLAGIQVYPNPATSNANVTFTLVENTNVQVAVYDAIGRLVNTAANQSMTKGDHTVSFNTANFAAGIYTVKVQTTNGAVSERLSVVK